MTRQVVSRLAFPPYRLEHKHDLSRRGAVPSRTVHCRQAAGLRVRRTLWEKALGLDQSSADYNCCSRAPNNDCCQYRRVKDLVGCVQVTRLQGKARRRPALGFCLFFAVRYGGLNRLLSVLGSWTLGFGDRR
jgi:hypothetical protein